MREGSTVLSRLRPVFVKTKGRQLLLKMLEKSETHYQIVLHIARA